MAALPLEQLQNIGQDIAALTEQKSRPIVCPMLDRSARACRVYANRPAACRTYGF
jgi:Fe-S-cluster containining protein